MIRTDDVPPAQRRDAWRGIVCDALGPLDMRVHGDAPPRGVIEAGRVDRPLRVEAQSGGYEPIARAGRRSAAGR